MFVRSDEDNGRSDHHLFGTFLFLFLPRQKDGDGRWKMEDGRWKMEDGRWKMEDGRWKMTDARFGDDAGRAVRHLRGITRPVKVILGGGRKGRLKQREDESCDEKEKEQDQDLCLVFDRSPRRHHAPGLKQSLDVVGGRGKLLSLIQEPRSTRVVGADETGKVSE